jgi:hypothetical protein
LNQGDVVGHFALGRIVRWMVDDAIDAQHSRSLPGRVGSVAGLGAQPGHSNVKLRRLFPVCVCQIIRFV